MLTILGATLLLAASPSSGSATPVAAATAKATPRGKAERVPPSSYKNGVPKGIFLGRSLLSGKAICLLFLDGGRISRAIPMGGLEEFHWDDHGVGGDAGTWTIKDGVLTARWGDGGVHTGPLTETPNGVEFYGKRYTRAETIAVDKLAGQWQSARTVMDLTVTHELEIGADGSYSWQTGAGGIVANRAVGGDMRDAQGKLTIKGGTAIFTRKDGTTESFTFIKMPGDDVAFSLDRDLFTRK